MNDTNLIINASFVSLRLTPSPAGEGFFIRNKKEEILRGLVQEARLRMTGCGGKKQKAKGEKGCRAVLTNVENL